MKFGLFYEISIPRPWTPEKERTVYNNCLEQVKLADELGFEHVWAVEHHFLEEYSHSSSPEIFLAAAAALWQRVGDTGRALDALHRALQLVYLALVEKEFTRALRFVVEQTGLGVDGNVTADQPQFAIANPGISFVERHLAVTQAFDFAPLQHHTTFDLVQDFVFVPRLAVLDLGLAGFLRHAGGALRQPGCRKIAPGRDTPEGTG